MEEQQRKLQYLGQRLKCLNLIELLEALRIKEEEEAEQNQERPEMVNCKSEKWSCGFGLVLGFGIGFSLVWFGFGLNGLVLQVLTREEGRGVFK